MAEFSQLPLLGSLAGLTLPADEVVVLEGWQIELAVGDQN